jgi:hypothetical protein
MIPYGTRPPHPIYIRVHDRLRGTQSSKHKTLYFLSPGPNSLFQTLISCLPSSHRCLEVDLASLLMLDQPRVLLPQRGPSWEEVHWFRRQRPYIPVWSAVITSLTGQSFEDHKFLHVVVFSGIFRCQHTHHMSLYFFLLSRCFRHRQSHVSSGQRISY